MQDRFVVDLYRLWLKRYVHKMRKKMVKGLMGLFVVVALLPVANHLLFTFTTRPEVVNRMQGSTGAEVKIISLNIAKGFAHRGGVNFDKPAAVRERLDAMARMLRDEDPDIVVLSEALWNCGPCPINQVKYLSDHTELKNYAFGENYNLGLPFYRIVGGNAILSRVELTGVRNQVLPGTRPVYHTRNNRKALWCVANIGGEGVMVGAFHNDSFDQNNRLAQLDAELEFCARSPAIMAGDFNDRPGSSSLKRMAENADRLRGVYDGAATSPVLDDGATYRIDWVFAPAGWEQVEDRVVVVPESDHDAVVAVYRLMKSGVVP